MKAGEFPFGVAIFGDQGGKLCCYHIAGFRTLAGAVRSKEQSWKDDPMRRVMQRQEDGKYTILNDVHRAYHPEHRD